MWEKEAKGGKEYRESQRAEEGGETARAQHQADKSCQPIRGALRSCRDPAWEPGAGGAWSPSLGSPRTGSSRAQSSEKVPPSASNKLSSFPPVRASQPR